MKSLLPAIAALALTLAAAGGSAAELRRETRALSSFSQIELDGQADVTLKQGTTEGVTLEATAQGLKQIRTEVRGRTLRITLVPQQLWWQWIIGGGVLRTPRITINFRELERIEASGAVTIVAGSVKAKELQLDFAGACKLKIADLQANRLRLDGAGAIRAEIAGKVAEQDIDLSGAGSYQGAGLVSENIALQVSGAGKAVVNATSTLKAEISGAGLVEYIGNPKVEQDISGIGKIKRR